MSIVEVYKTNVDNCFQSSELLYVLRKRFPEYKANFDLSDCDRILRIESPQPQINSESIIGFMNEFGYLAEPLPD